jgi:NADPH:quinone reductase-like Zn-dependent oxidoreductase
MSRNRPFSGNPTCSFAGDSTDFVRNDGDNSETINDNDQTREADMSRMRAMVVQQAGAKLRLEERDVPEPGRREVRIEVHACGVCHSDSVTVEGLIPGIVYPRIPGHEVIGVIDALGADVDGWTVGERAGVGWFGGSCGIAAAAAAARRSPARPYRPPPA